MPLQVSPSAIACGPYVTTSNSHSCTPKQRNLVFPSSSIWSLVLRSQVINICPDGSFDDDWPLYLKDEASRIDLRPSLPKDFADIEKVVEEYNKRKRTSIRYFQARPQKVSLGSTHRIVQAYQTQREVSYDRNMQRFAFVSSDQGTSSSTSKKRNTRKTYWMS